MFLYAAKPFGVVPCQCESEYSRHEFPALGFPHDGLHLYVLAALRSAFAGRSRQEASVCFSGDSLHLGDLCLQYLGLVTPKTLAFGLYQKLRFVLQEILDFTIDRLQSTRRANNSQNMLHCFRSMGLVGMKVPFR